MPLSALAKAASCQHQFQSKENNQFDCRLQWERTRSWYFCVFENDADAHAKHQQNYDIYAGLTRWQLRGKATTTTSNRRLSQGGWELLRCIDRALSCCRRVALGMI
jgi:hypothetical protein